MEVKLGLRNSKVFVQNTQWKRDKKECTYSIQDLQNALLIATDQILSAAVQYSQ
jgi:hypothetical protein